MWPAAIVYTFIASSLVSAASENTLSFSLSHSWNFPETKSRSLILNDRGTPIDVIQSLKKPLKARVAVQEGSSATYSAEDTLRGQTIFDSPSERIVGDSEAPSPAPDVTDRYTLVNLAKASWDAYYPGPEDSHWYDIDGMNWVSVPSLGLFQIV